MLLENGAEFLVLLFSSLTEVSGSRKPDQLKTLSTWVKFVTLFGDIQNKYILFGGNFNVIFYSFLEAQEGNQVGKIHFSKINSNKGKARPCQHFENLKSQKQTFYFQIILYNRIYSKKIILFLLPNQLQETA